MFDVDYLRILLGYNALRERFGTETRHETARWHFKRCDAGKTPNVVIFRFDRECYPQVLLPRTPNIFYRL
ncbi:hypothetical protein DPMN_158732 [Dreissena polymorpha]|uniref:Uncharacterized protein n=1 Tax=Dreissena polymorpha TaxID=45954 RepID=A0A9D4IQ30_DREPO|nr:hypothetical protein DPMN_158732 [Dreissena polymorpha]